jgi:hypothetical protein
MLARCVSPAALHFARASKVRRVREAVLVFD